MVRPRWLVYEDGSLGVNPLRVFMSVVSLSSLAVQRQIMFKDSNHKPSSIRSYHVSEICTASM
ncbi:hypothetical protein E2C01_098400 [Portunus trituberculatus]|uniref:Uncharacterized protein n=1 Tax=Portunus trituberculatus TaxID=210409 RepID=A0A5B7K7J6_PORTR|nr:hypothetical protein [Portunus trituberculatus]